jgi:hypothetical protein
MSLLYSECRQKRDALKFRKTEQNTKNSTMEIQWFKTVTLPYTDMKYKHYIEHIRYGNTGNLHLSLRMLQARLL